MEEEAYLLGKRINLARKDYGLTAEKLSEQCNINAVYLRQIEGGRKTPSLPVFISLCNALKVSPSYLLQDLVANYDLEKSEALAKLWDAASPTQMRMITAMIQAALASVNADCIDE